MADRTPHRSPKVLRRIAALLIRSPETRFILDDLDELLARDLARGMPPSRAWWRYGKNMLASAFSVWRVRRRVPVLRAFSWLDFKLGFRMLVKYPGLTVIGGLAMAFAIAVGAGGFELATQYIRPRLPLDDGDRIVGIRLWHTASGHVEARALHDFVLWREELESVEDLGAFRTVERNLISGEGRGEPVEVAEISASAFRVTRVPPLRGRFLVEADERAGAPPVAVIGYDVWQMQFGGDPDLVGRTVRLGSEPRTVVGIMPKGFGFPIDHSVWVPLRLDVSDYERGGGPAIRVVFGRLAPGATLETAQAELTTFALRTAADFPDTHEHLRPRVLPYAQSITNASGEIRLALTSVNLFFVTLLVLVCGNVALLMFARATTRESELVVRSALGASRGRIIAQLLAEALVLAGVAAVVGLAVAGFALKDWLNVVEKESGGSIPFWFGASIAPTTVLYAGLLTVLGAVIAGVVPALKVTRRLGARLRRAAAGAGGLRFGGLWTGVIIAQVAVTVVFPAMAFEVRRMVVEVRTADVGFPSEEYLSARLEMDRESAAGVPADTSYAAFLGRFGAAIQELERRVQAEPGVAGVTFADPVPRTLHPWFWIEVDDAGAASPDTAIRHRVVIASIDPGFFDVLDIPILSGRGFHSGDRGSERATVIVNQSFVQRVLAGRNPIGRRVRYVRPVDEEPGPWYEIVGVVRNVGMLSETVNDAGLYLPAAPGDDYPMRVAVHLTGDPASFAPRLRNIAMAVDPTLRVHEPLPLDQAGFRVWSEFAVLFRLLTVISSIALILALAGIYSVMSFTVSRRTREIGIRVALGSNPRHVVAAIFRRPLAQLGFGVITGGGLVTALAIAEPLLYSNDAVVRTLSVQQIGLLVAYATFMMGVCLLACVMPTRRALRIEPTEALRADG